MKSNHCFEIEFSELLHIRRASEYLVKASFYENSTYACSNSYRTTVKVSAAPWGRVPWWVPKLLPAASGHRLLVISFRDDLMSNALPDDGGLCSFFEIELEHNALCLRVKAPLIGQVTSNSMMLSKKQRHQGRHINGRLQCSAGMKSALSLWMELICFTPIPGVTFEILF